MRVTNAEHLPEDERIDTIVKMLLNGELVGVALESKKLRKIARYIRKISAACPGCAVLEQTDTDYDVTVVRFRPPLNS